MKRGICSWFNEADCRKAKDRGITFVKLDVNYLADDLPAGMD